LGLIFAVFIVFNLGIILQMASSSIPLFVAGRFFAGLGVGMMSALVPLYQVK
jgi:MFS family permease